MILLVIHYVCLSCTVTDVLTVGYWRDLETWIRNRSRSLEIAPFDRSQRLF